MEVFVVSLPGPLRMILEDWSAIVEVVHCLECSYNFFEYIVVGLFSVVYHMLNSLMCLVP